MKRYDPAEHFGEEMLDPSKLAKYIGKSSKTARRLMKDHPDVLVLPRRGAAGKRAYNSYILPESAAKEIYASMRVNKTA